MSSGIDSFLESFSRMPRQDPQIVPIVRYIDAESIKNDCEQRDILAFITEFSELENYFCQPAHLKAVFDLTTEQSVSIYEDCLRELEVETRRKLFNFIMRSRPRLSKNSGGMLDHAIIQSNVDLLYQMHAAILTPGKELMGKLKARIQQDFRKAPNLIHTGSPALKSSLFTALVSG